VMAAVLMGRRRRGLGMVEARVNEGGRKGKVVAQHFKILCGGGTTYC
jgi:hypothetical protein